MADEVQPTPEEHGPEQRPSWIARLLLGALGITAILHYLAQKPREHVVEAHASSAEEVHHPDGRIEHPLVRFEQRDTYFAPILVIIIAAIVYASFHFATVWWYFNQSERHQSAIKRSSFPLQQSPPDSLPPEPRLEQINRMAEIQTGNVYVMEASKEHALHTYGTTPEGGYVHIPIERAMEMLANKLPARKEPPGDSRKGNGLIDSGESNSGRMLRGEPQWFER